MVNTRAIKLSLLMFTFASPGSRSFRPKYVSSQFVSSKKFGFGLHVFLDETVEVRFVQKW